MIIPNTFEKAVFVIDPDSRALVSVTLLARLFESLVVPASAHRLFPGLCEEVRGKIYGKVYRKDIP